MSPGGAPAQVLRGQSAQTSHHIYPGRSMRAVHRVRCQAAAGGPRHSVKRNSRTQVQSGFFFWELDHPGPIVVSAVSAILLPAGRPAGNENAGHRASRDRKSRVRRSLCSLVVAPAVSSLVVYQPHLAMRLPHARADATNRADADAELAFRLPAKLRGPGELAQVAVDGFRHAAASARGECRPSVPGQNGLHLSHHCPHGHLSRRPQCPASPYRVHGPAS